MLLLLPLLLRGRVRLGGLKGVNTTVDLLPPAVCIPLLFLPRNVLSPGFLLAHAFATGVTRIVWSNHVHVWLCIVVASSSVPQPDLAVTLHVAILSTSAAVPLEPPPGVADVVLVPKPVTTKAAVQLCGAPGGGGDSR